MKGGEKMNKKVFSIRLGGLRNEAGITAQQLGERIGVPRGTIAHWEAGDFYPNNERLVALADALNCSIDYLMGRTDCKNSISVLTAEGDRVVDLAEFTEEQQELIKSLVRQFKK